MKKAAIVVLIFVIGYICASVKCGLPPEVLNAHAVIPDRQNKFDLFDLDDLVNYTCNNGYLPSNGGLPTAKCLRYNGTAKWFGPKFTCVALTCGNPGTIINGHQHGFVYQNMSSVKYTCNEGYELHGSPIRTCQADRTWNGEVPYCFPKQCSRPADPLHGIVLGTSLDYLAKITYKCKEGYRLIGQLSRSCEADGTWSGQAPICEELRCNSLDYLEHGYFEGNETRYGATVEFYCNEGATLVGAMSVTCKKDGWSSAPPKCLAACFLPEIENGVVRKGPVTKLVLHNHQIEILCNPNYKLEKPENPKCNNGIWSYHPKCVPDHNLHCVRETEIQDHCGSRCEPTCSNVLHRVEPCPQICDPPACRCKEGFARHEGRCIRVAECPVDTFTCVDPEREQVNRCGKKCEQACQTRNPICTRDCKGPPECVCKQGFYRKVNSCVTEDKCT